MDFSTKVSVKLLLSGLENEETSNMLTSPLSYNAMLNMVAAGSSAQTRDQILECLERSSIEEVNADSSKLAEITAEQTCTTNKRKVDQEYPNIFSGAPSLSFLNAVWLDHKFAFDDSFQDLLQNLYTAKLSLFDPLKPKMVVEEANEWANASTKGLIKEVLQENHITPTTRLILSNSLYFKGSWEEMFDSRFTTDMLFHLLTGEKIKAPFMTGRYGYGYSHKSFQDFQVARIPYKAGGDVNRKFAMYVFLPTEKDGLQDLLKKVDSDPDFFETHCDIPYSLADVFYLPKFKFSYLTDGGVNIMKSMGLTLPFDNHNAEFYEMIANGKEVFGDQRLHVASIVQKAYIEVNEQGTEATAVTMLRMAGGGGGRPREKFIADHPFMFIIREENSGLLFFSGTVLNPLEA